MTPIASILQDTGCSTNEALVHFMPLYPLPLRWISRLWGLTFLLFSPITSSHPLPLQLASSDYAPYSGSNLPDKGLSSRLILAALAAVDVREPELHFLPWAKGYDATADGRFDAAYPYSWNPQRDKQFFFSESLHTETLSWYSHKENLAALRGEWHRMRVCQPQGWDMARYDEVVNKFHLRLVRLTTLDACLLQLARRQSDLVVLNEVLFHSASEQLFGSHHQLLALPYYQQQQTLHLIVPRKRHNAERLIALINQGLAALHKNGRYELLQQGSTTAQNDSHPQHRRMPLLSPR